MSQTTSFWRLKPELHNIPLDAESSFYILFGIQSTVRTFQMCHTGWLLEEYPEKRHCCSCIVLIVTVYSICMDPDGQRYASWGCGP